MEVYSFNLMAIKYCDVKDKGSGKACHKIFNDSDAIKVIGTCFHIMWKHWQKDNSVNFVFHASLRHMTEEILSKKAIPIALLPPFLENYRRAQYQIYRYGMLNLFSYEHFIPFSDKINCVYVLINRNQQNPYEIIDKLTSFLLEHHDILFDPEG